MTASLVQIALIALPGVEDASPTEHQREQMSISYSSPAVSAAPVLIFADARFTQEPTKKAEFWHQSQPCAPGGSQTPPPNRPQLCPRLAA
jgi:hypothetical protein